MSRNKVTQANEIIAAGKFTLPSPQEIVDAMSPAGGWTAATLAGWGIKWKPQHGWRKELERRWKAENA